MSPPGRHVAFVGNSGNAEGGMSHTHFELHLGSRILNPYPYLVAGQAVALEAAEKQHLADTVHDMCQPEDGEPAIDSDVCPHPPTTSSDPQRRGRRLLGLCRMPA